jgi:hypothetical protein
MPVGGSAVRPSEQWPQQQLGRPLRDPARPAGRDPHRHGARTPGALVEDGGDPSYERLRRGGDRTAAEQDEVDVQQADVVRGAGAEHPRGLADLPPRDRPQTQRLDAAAVSAAAEGPVQLDDLMSELPRAGPGSPVHGPTDHEPGTEPRTEVQVGEGPARPTDGQPERRRVGVLVHDDRHRQPPCQRVAQGEPVPLGKPGDPVQDAPGVVEGAGEGDADAEKGADSDEGRSGDEDLPSRSASTSRAAPSTTASAPVPRLSADVRSATTAPVRSHSTAVSSSRSRCSPTACPAPGTSRKTVRGLPPVDARRPASAARPSSRSRAVILLTAWGVSPVRSASSRRLMPSGPAVRSRSSTSAVLWLRSASRLAPPFVLFTRVILPRTCTLATALRKWGP